MMDERMTCQVCGRKILARQGSIAHHGYTRPGSGWQTGSCPGAKYSPFENHKDRLAAIRNAQAERATFLRDLAQEANEGKAGVTVRWTEYLKEARYNSRPRVAIVDDLAAFAALVVAEPQVMRMRPMFSFAEARRIYVSGLTDSARQCEDFVKEADKRLAGWKYTHRYDRPNKAWVAA